MTHTLYIIIIIITGLVSSLMTWYLPTLKRRYKRITTRRERKLRNIVQQEVEHAIKQIVND